MRRQVTLEEAQGMDRADELAGLRDGFELPEGVIYLDGNSLGPLQALTRLRVTETVASQWGEGLIRSWNTHDWIDLPSRVGARIARLIGAAPGTVTVTDSTSVNLFKLLAVALQARPGRRVIVSEKGNFPTDLYVAQGLMEMLGNGYSLRTVDADALAGSIDGDVAVVMLTEVNYRTGSKLDMVELTGKAHAVGALTIWDLAHSAGAFPVDVTKADADFAVGCGYKYLNGGPGAPSFVYVAPRFIGGLRQPISGWLGHARPFAFEDVYQPAASIECMRTGTPPILSLAALDTSLEVFERVDMHRLRSKADRLFDVFDAQVAARCPQLQLATPREPGKRGTQIAFRFAEGYAVMQALIARGVIGDFRGPDIMRFGFAPLYLRYEDVWKAADILGDIMESGAWDRADYKVRAKVV